MNNPREIAQFAKQQEFLKKMLEGYRKAIVNPHVGAWNMTLRKDGAWEPMTTADSALLGLPPQRRDCKIDDAEVEAMSWPERKIENQRRSMLDTKFGQAVVCTLFGMTPDDINRHQSIASKDIKKLFGEMKETLDSLGITPVATPLPNTEQPFITYIIDPMRFTFGLVEGDIALAAMRHQRQKQPQSPIKAAKLIH